jgi:rubrerythrin
MKWLTGSKRPERDGVLARAAVVDLLCHRYVREKQHAMRYRQHAQRVDPRFRETLLIMAAEEERHASLVGAKLRGLGGDLPDVIPIHVPQEDNSWSYLRTDLQEEQRCNGELHDEMPAIGSHFPDVRELLDRMDGESAGHRALLRAMLAQTVPEPLGV